MNANLINEEKAKLKNAIAAALQEFTKQTTLRIEEIKVSYKEFKSDAGAEYFYNDILFKVGM